MADVALRNVVKRFDEVEAVRNISLNIPDNECKANSRNQ
jgi:ABC-type sugar transport system ATPase subunit